MTAPCLCDLSRCVPCDEARDAELRRTFPNEGEGMSQRVDSSKIEGIVGATRHPLNHIARAVSDEQTVYILHSQACLDRETTGERDLVDCPYSKALDRGIDVEQWVEDEPVRVMVSFGNLIPYEVSS